VCSAPELEEDVRLARVDEDEVTEATVEEELLELLVTDAAVLEELELLDELDSLWLLCEVVDWVESLVRLTAVELLELEELEVTDAAVLELEEELELLELSSKVIVPLNSTQGLLSAVVVLSSGRSVASASPIRSVWVPVLRTSRNPTSITIRSPALKLRLVNVREKFSEASWKRRLVRVVVSSGGAAETSSEAEAARSVSWTVPAELTRRMAMASVALFALLFSEQRIWPLIVPDTVWAAS
jgi:hypothetical protein